MNGSPVYWELKEQTNEESQALHIRPDRKYRKDEEFAVTVSCLY
jgi:hypothetical protein